MNARVELAPSGYVARRIAEIEARKPVAEVAGALSPAEVVMIPEAEFRGAGAVQHECRTQAMTIYHAALRRAELMLDELRDVTCAGHNSTSVEQSVRLFRAIDRHVMAQCWLREAAQGVVDAFDYDDNGRAAGIVWSTPIGAEGA